MSTSWDSPGGPVVAPKAGGPDTIRGRGTRFPMLQLRILHAATKTRSSQINKEIFLKKKRALSQRGRKNYRVVDALEHPQYFNKGALAHSVEALRKEWPRAASQGRYH